MAILSIEQLQKTYKGDIQALKGVSFSVAKGEFVALLGPNGAGKTTLINILAGNVKKTSGTVAIDGLDLDTNEIDTKYKLGIVPQEVNFDSFFSVDEVLRHQLGYFGQRYDEAYVDSVLDSLTLLDKKKVNTRALSGGMRRRLIIAKAMIHRPPILVLDEPTAGVDVELRHSLYRSLRKLHEQGTTIILTTHYLEEAEALCDRIIMINKGDMIIDEPKEKLMQRYQHQVELRVSFPEKAPVLPDSYPDSEQKNATTLSFSVCKREVPQLLLTLEQDGYSYDNYELREQSLEDIFVDLTSS